MRRACSGRSASRLTQPLFDAGRLAPTSISRSAGYDATVANYRRVVLTAMQEVEDGITGLAALERASAQARTAVETARARARDGDSRYEGGASTYLDVITAQQALLDERAPGGAAARPAPARPRCSSSRRWAATGSRSPKVATR